MDIQILIELVTKVLVGFAIGVAIGMTGVGGGAVVQPVLIHVFGIPPVQAVGTGLVYAMITRIGGAISHFRLHTVRPRRSFFFLLGSVPGVLVSSCVVNALSDSLDVTRVNNVLQLSMALVLMVTVFTLLFQDLFLSEMLERSRRIYGKGGPFPLRKKIISISAGMVIGIVIGATSIGGGVLIIPVFALFLDASTLETVGSSIVISLFLSVIGGIVYLLDGNVRLLTAVFLCVGSIPGVILGSRLSVKVPERILRMIVIVIIFLSSISLFFGVSGH